jgi:hypothetical protein
LEWEAAGADTFIPTSRNRVSAASGRGDVALEAAVVATEWRLMRFHSVRRSMAVPIRIAHEIVDA